MNLILSVVISRFAVGLPIKQKLIRLKSSSPTLPLTNFDTLQQNKAHRPGLRQDENNIDTLFF